MRIVGALIGAEAGAAVGLAVLGGRLLALATTAVGAAAGALAAVAPGATTSCAAFVRTPLVEQQIADQARAHEVPKQRVLEDVVLAPHAIKRLIEPEEVAEVVAFLAGPGGRGFTRRLLAEVYQNDRSVPGLILLTRKLRKKKPK